MSASDSYEEFNEYDDMEDIMVQISEMESREEQKNKEEIDRVDKIYEAFHKCGSNMGSKRLMDELKKFNKSEANQCGYSIEMLGDNLYRWHIKLFDFPADTPLYADMKSANIDHILLEVTYPNRYPIEPPFIRILKPKFQFMTGHVTIGGSICMEVLTKSGWSPAYSIESLIVQIKAEMIDGGARLNLADKSEYTMAEAESAFKRTADKYGWK